MTINIGSKNPVKIEAVREIIVNYPFMADAAIEPKIRLAADFWFLVRAL